MEGVSRRIDQSIIEVFIWDENDGEKTAKESLLHQTLNDIDPQVRRASAFISGLRGDQRTIPILAETVVSSSHEWQLRAVKALGVIKDARCGPPLILALEIGRDRLHREARRALQNLGPLAKDAWLGALDHPDAHIRWHAARGLAEMGDVRAISVLAEGLLDESYVVRWATATGLSQLGVQAVPAILTVLIQHELTEPARKATCQALQGIRSTKYLKQIEPLLKALHRSIPSNQVSVIAQKLLDDWEREA
jgi:HEAT repeat protein